MNRHFIYLIHHNRPNLLKAQISLFSKLFPDATLVIGLTCHIYNPKHRAAEMFSIAKNEGIRVIESDSGRSKWNQFVQSVGSLPLLRSVILRTPGLRKKMGQDPSSGHARLLNKVMKDLRKLSVGDEIWILEGDVFPIKNPIRLTSEMGVRAISSHFFRNGKRHEYLNARYLNFRLTGDSRLDDLILHLDWSPLHTLTFWHDTGSRTFKTLNSLKTNLSDLEMEILATFPAGSLEFDEAYRRNFPAQILDLFKNDPRSTDGRVYFDIYNDSWVHIGKMSGYFQQQNVEVLDQLEKLTIQAIESLFEFSG